MGLSKQPRYLREDMLIRMAGFSTRVKNLLLNNGIHTIGQLKCMTSKRLLEFHNFGRKALSEVLERQLVEQLIDDADNQRQKRVLAYMKEANGMRVERQAVLMKLEAIHRCWQQGGKSVTLDSAFNTLIEQLRNDPERL